MVTFKDVKEYESIINELVEADFLLNLFDIPPRLEESVDSLKDEIVKRLENQKGYVISDGIRRIFYLLFMKEIIKKTINMRISFGQMADLINDFYNRRLIATLLNRIVENIPNVQEKIIEEFQSKSLRRIG